MRRSVVLTCVLFVAVTASSTMGALLAAEKTHEVRGVVISVDVAQGSVTFSDEKGKSRTLAVQGKGRETLPTLKPGDRISVTYTVDGTGAPQEVTNIKVTKRGGTRVAEPRIAGQPSQPVPPVHLPKHPPLAPICTVAGTLDVASASTEPCLRPTPAATCQDLSVSLSQASNKPAPVPSGIATTTYTVIQGGKVSATGNFQGGTCHYSLTLPSCPPGAVYLSLNYNGPWTGTAGGGIWKGVPVGSWSNPLTLSPQGGITADLKLVFECVN